MSGPAPRAPQGRTRMTGWAQGPPLGRAQVNGPVSTLSALNSTKPGRDATLAVGVRRGRGQKTQNDKNKNRSLGNGPSRSPTHLQNRNRNLLFLSKTCTATFSFPQLLGGNRDA